MKVCANFLGKMKVKSENDYRVYLKFEEEVQDDPKLLSDSEEVPVSY